MKKLSDHNTEKERQYLWDKEHAHLAGVLCDACNTQMHYSEPHSTNLSYPPTKWVFCPNSECSQFKEKNLKTV